MTHKPPDRPIGVGKILFAIWVLAGIGASADAQQQQQHLSRSHRLSEALSQSQSIWVEPPSTPPLLEEQNSDRSLPDTSSDENENQKKHNNEAAPKFKDTRADLIPYALDERSIRDVVRAPARSAGAKPRGLSSRLTARSLQDWKVEGIVLLATVDGGIYAADRDSGATLWQWPGDKPMVETQYHASNRSTDGTSGGPLLNDFIWIVEPSQDGALYGYTPGKSLGMQKLGLTVKDLVNDLSGYESDDPRVVYNGEKKTTLYTIDIATGLFIKAFTAGSSLVNKDLGMCRQNGELDSLDDENKCAPIGTLTVTRTEYTVGIHSYEGDPICTIKYSEWGPNIRDKDLHLQHSKAKDHRYIHSKYNGEINAFDHQTTDGPISEKDLEPKYRQKYSSHVVRVFDIARPLHSTSYETPLILLPQPLDPVFSLADSQNVLISSTDSGSLYALSQASYPLVTYGAGLAECVRTDWLTNEKELTLQEYLVGVHPLDSSDTSYLVPGLEGGFLPPALDAPNNDTPGSEEELPTLPAPESPRVIGLNYTQIFVAVLVICLTGVGAGRFLPSTSLFGKSTMLPELPVAEAPTYDVPLPAEIVEPAPVQEKDKKSVGFAEDVEKENEPPVESGPIPQDEAIVEEDLLKAKKRAHRGKRGGKKEANKRALKEILHQDEIDGIVEGVKQMNQQMSVTPDVIYQTNSEDKDAPAGLLNLEIQTDQVLGHGSGGTLVFEGKFEGRDVAVKRMLGQYSELASQEVSLLEQSEDHPNVIRYFCRRQDEHFLYIALELCQASLWDLYRDGRIDEVDHKFYPIIEEINNQPNRVLRQLAEGLKHLHTFRIVHRDIKPQNMLIAYPKKHMTSVFPRIVISDFGLCKSLPEGASTLIGATISAGTIGWKAPELISQPKENSGVSASNHSTGKDSSNGDFAGAFGIKRSTDIFSLGCVFFYVLTGGQHPFDDEEGWMGIRERNIKSNKCNLEAISIHGPDTVDLIGWMLEPKPEDRPTASEVLAHPFFWNAEDRLEFLSLTSDRFDMEARDGTSRALAKLESYAEDVIGAGPTTLNLSTNSRYNTSSANHHRSSSDSSSTAINMPMPGEPNFLAALDKKFIDTLGKQRKYQGYKLVDLLRALRNKHHHWDDMPDDVKLRVGAVPEGYLRYWEQRFPKLTVRMWRVVRDLGMGNERRYWRWFGGRVE